MLEAGQLIKIKYMGEYHYGISALVSTGLETSWCVRLVNGVFIPLEDNGHWEVIGNIVFKD